MNKSASLLLVIELIAVESYFELFQVAIIYSLRYPFKENQKRIIYSSFLVELRKFHHCNHAVLISVNKSIFFFRIRKCMFNILAIYTDGNDIYVAGGQTIDNE